MYPNLHLIFSVRDLSALSKSKSQESELSNRIDNFIVETQTEGRLEPGKVYVHCTVLYCTTLMYLIINVIVETRAKGRLKLSSV